MSVFNTDGLLLAVLATTAAIFLEEGEDSDVVLAWAAVDNALHEFPPALAAKTAVPSWTDDTMS